MNGQKVKVKTVGYIENAERKPVPSENGDPIIDFVFSAPGGQGMQSFLFRKGEVLDYPGFSAGFEAGQETAIKFFRENGQLYMTSDSILEETTMANQETTSFEPGDTIPTKNMFLYGLNGFRFLIRNFLPNAKFSAVKSQNQTGENAAIVEISDGINRQTVPVFGMNNTQGDTVSVPLGNGELKLAFGAKPIFLSFSIFLKNFQLERYPGSQSPSSFASDVVLIDESVGKRDDLRIYMNNTLTYKGYKFFQSSYDTDEKGTILSVNHDMWGTWITYIGYALLILGFILSLANKHSYFQFSARKLKRISVKTILLVFALGALPILNSAQSSSAAGIPKIEATTVDAFSRLWVQGADGRIEPISTLASEIVRKVSRKSSLYGKSSDEVVLSMMTHPEIWRTLPFVRVSEKELANELGISGNTIAVDQLFDMQGNH